MKVQSLKHNQILEVFGQYQVRGKQCYLVSPDKYPGLLAVSSEDVVIIDSELKDFVEHDDGYSSGSYFRPIFDEPLIEPLLECQPEAYMRFLEILKSISNET